MQVCRSIRPGPEKLNWSKKSNGSNRYPSFLQFFLNIFKKHEYTLILQYITKLSLSSGDSCDKRVIPLWILTFFLTSPGQPQSERTEWRVERSDHQPKHPGSQESDVGVFLRLSGCWDQLCVSFRGWLMKTRKKVNNIYSFVSVSLTSAPLSPADGGHPQTGGDQLQTPGLHWQNHRGHHGVKPLHPRGQIETTRGRVLPPAGDKYLQTYLQRM